jgi:hypothetical protein
VTTHRLSPRLVRALSFATAVFVGGILPGAEADRTAAPAKPGEGSATTDAKAPASQRERLIQMAVRANLRQIDAAAYQFATDKGRWPKDVAELVAERDGYYLKPVAAVDGESYGKLDLGPDSPSWSIKTASGVSVVFERSL